MVGQSHGNVEEIVLLDYYESAAIALTVVRSCFEQAQVCFTLFVCFALAVPQNVTVDDAVLTGTVIPQYLPSDSSWGQGANCTQCLVKPDPSLAYNHTWHDTTFYPNSGVSQAVQFTFVGSALYIFFILANNVTNATTLTNVNFIMDGAAGPSFLHTPSASTDYEYNQAVYTNDSLTFGEHTMMIVPVNSGNSLLILFDYLIYTTDTDSVVTSAVVLPSASASSGSSQTSDASSGQNTGAIVGGTVAGVVVMVVIVSLSFYRRYRRRNGRRSPAKTATVAEPFVLPLRVAPMSSKGISPTIYQTESPIDELGSRSVAGTSSASSQPLIPPAAITSSPSAESRSTGTTGLLLEQVEQLRDEVARLRYLRNSDQNAIDLGSEAPPEYSQGQLGQEVESVQL